MMKKKQSTGSDYTSIEEHIHDVAFFKPEMKVALYGEAGTGKTTLAADFPKPALLIDCSERGTDSVRDIKGLKVLRAKNFDEVELAYWYIKKNPGKFKTVIIDTVSHAQDLAIKRLIERKNKNTNVKAGKLGAWGTMTKQDWGTVSTDVKSLILNFRDLPQNIVFLAHDRTFNSEDDGLEDENKIKPTIGPRLSPATAATLNAAVSVIGNTFIREKYITKKIGKKTIEKKQTIYCLRIGPNSVYTTKIRKPKKFLLPDIIKDPSYEKLIDVINGISE